MLALPNSEFESNPSKSDSPSATPSSSICDHESSSFKEGNGPEAEAGDSSIAAS